MFHRVASITGLGSLVVASAIVPLPALAAIPYPISPSWQSTPNGYVSTGGGFADINRDGWPDFVAANGNDISRQHLTVYLNAGNGTFPRQLEPAVGGHRVQRAPGPGRRER